MEMVLSLPRVQLRYRLHMFSSLFFIENQSAKYMFVSNEHDKMFQLFWLEKQYEKKACSLVNCACIEGVDWNGHVCVM